VAALGTLREALAATLDGIADLNVYPRVADAVNLPAVIVVPASSRRETMQRGVVVHMFDLYVLASSGELTVGQVSLDELIDWAGPNSIPAALDANKTLGVTTSGGQPDADATWEGFDRYGGHFDTANIDHIGAVGSVMVATRGRVV
jgi:hypothetical protein